MPFRRWVEVELHHVDLGIGYELEESPAQFTEREIAFLADRFAGRPDVPPTRLTDGTRAWSTGRETGRRPEATVTGSPATCSALARRPPYRSRATCGRRPASGAAPAVGSGPLPRYRLADMTYSGQVTVGGPADVHELKDLMITKIAVGPMNNNAYLLRCRATDEQLLIDAANEAQTLLGMIGDDGIASVVTTHQHGDHWQALAEVVAATGARTYAGRDDADGIPCGPTCWSTTATPSGGARAATARHLVGHTPGFIALVYDDPHGHPHVFTGDCLFPGGVGNTHKDPKAFASLIDDVETKIFDAPARDVGLPRARERHVTGCGAPASAGVARARMVTGRAGATACVRSAPGARMRPRGRTRASAGRTRVSARGAHVCSRGAHTCGAVGRARTPCDPSPHTPVPHVCSPYT
ncbi:Hydroxyacylglutathione hydrolase [Streptomyces violarus]